MARKKTLGWVMVKRLGWKDSGRVVMFMCLWAQAEKGTGSEIGRIDDFVAACQELGLRGVNRATGFRWLRLFRKVWPDLNPGELFRAFPELRKLAGGGEASLASELLSVPAEELGVLV